jgi:hypothetical protein
MIQKIEIYDSQKLSFAFSDVGGETYLTFGDDVVSYHLQVPTYNPQISTEKTKLPEELRTPNTAKAVFERLHVDGHISRDGMEALDSHFRQVSATVRLDKPLPGEVRRTAGVWATRQLPALDKVA